MPAVPEELEAGDREVQEFLTAFQSRIGAMITRPFAPSGPSVAGCLQTELRRKTYT